MINGFNPAIHSQSRRYAKAFNHKLTPTMLTILSTMLGLVPFLFDSPNEVFWFNFAIATIGGICSRCWYCWSSSRYSPAGRKTLKRPARLYFQMHIFLVKEPEEEPFGCEGADRQRNRNPESRETMLRKTLYKEVRDA